MPERNLRDLAQSVNKLSDTITKVSHEQTQAVAKDFCIAVINGTPVDTGQARSNWIASVDTQDVTFRPAYFPGSKLGIGESDNANAAIAQCLSFVFGAKPGSSIFVQNNAPYILELNNGKSNQAPALFIERALTLALRNRQRKVTGR